MGRKIIDCFTFYNELDLLTYKLNVLNDIVDYFVLVEATHTFIGKEKTLYYESNKEAYKKFHKKIIHVIVDDFPYKSPNIDINKGDQWINENFQRIAIGRGIKQIELKQDDLIIIGDLDEIADPNTLKLLKYNPIPNNLLVCLTMDMYYYNLTTRFRDKWFHAKILTYDVMLNTGKSCEEIRMTWNIPAIDKGGWHLSYFGDAKFIKNKIVNFAHQEFNKSEYTDIGAITKRVQESNDLFGRNNCVLDKISVKENKYLPPQYQTYLKKYYD